MPTKKDAASNQAATQPVIEMTPGISPEQITDYLKAALQANRVSFLSVGLLLARVRDNKLYAKLGHGDLESYAKERLQLSHTTLYEYLRVYDWVAQNHHDWLNPGPDTFIPDLKSIDALTWIDKELPRKDLSTESKANLLKLKEKALTGKMKKSERAALLGRTRHTAKDGLKSFLSKMRSLRKEGAKLAGVPPEIVSGLGNLIEMLQHAVKSPSLRVLEGGESAKMPGVAPNKIYTKPLQNNRLQQSTPGRTFAKKAASQA